ncbi:MAG: hypothetical protein AMJ79_00215 [Phycisphaerae bacterium SM23_30]|nr:MAG: hypothetical protein AMJ79_00215 [Phycisphaerae bacterium SM23_30]
MQDDFGHDFGIDFRFGGPAESDYKSLLFMDLRCLAKEFYSEISFLRYAQSQHFKRPFIILNWTYQDMEREQGSKPSKYSYRGIS